MPSLSPGDRHTLRAIVTLAHSNPFLQERTEAEKHLLGSAFSDRERPWHADATLDGEDPNVAAVGEKVANVLPAIRERLASGASASPEDLASYETATSYFLYSRYANDFYELIEKPPNAIRRVPFYDRFVEDVRRLLEVPGAGIRARIDAPRLFAWGFQVRRAFHFTFRQIYGGSLPAARLRGAVWESIFTNDMARYRRTLHERMGDITTLIVGESGTGKELVARAIALARYVPFDPERRAFVEDFTTLFRPVNLSALSPTLIESELFGHRRGAFTGAVHDRSGYLEPCPAVGTVFLDEIGDLTGEIQVKLLRVLQSRVFQRIGETEDRLFRGKIIAATNRDLAKEIREGRFRADFYYRLCADVIATPTLREQLDERPEDLRNLLLIIARRVSGEDEAPALAQQVHSWVTANLGESYPWPGNIRELEQCVRNVLIRGTYVPLSSQEQPEGDLFAPLYAGTATAEEALRRYCRQVYRLTGSYVEAARRLGLDRRTVKAKVEFPRS